MTLSVISLSVRTVLTVCPPLPGRGKQALDGGDEDEHDEGAHQVGFEHLVPHLGVLQHEKKRKEKEEEGGEGRMEKQVFRQSQKSEQSEDAPQTHTDAPPQTHSTVQPQALERDRSWWVSRGVLWKLQS